MKVTWLVDGTTVGTASSERTLSWPLAIGAHEIEVRDARASLWLDSEEAPEAAYDEHQFDRVTEVSVFLYSGRDDMFTRVCRYFPSPDCVALKRIFLAHYPQEGTRIQPHVRERVGVWIHREVEASSAVSAGSPQGPFSRVRSLNP